MFFVDLPSEQVRGEIFALHLAQCRQDPALFDLPLLAQLTEGFSGAEIEQAIVSSLFAAVTDRKLVDTALIAEEIGATRPLSVTMHEKVSALREWALGRTVPADG
jgi:ATP-dependent 26S proteasome regulatory subunit